MLRSILGIGRSRDTHYVDNGRVTCPVSGRDVDVAECYGCPLLLDFADASGDKRGYVVCRAETVDDPRGRTTAPWF